MRQMSLLFAAVLGCGSGSASTSQLQLLFASGDSGAGDAPAVHMRAGETRIVELVAVGTSSGPVGFLGRDLPSFAALQGPLLTLAPQRVDTGEYDLHLAVTAGHERRDATLHLSVQRFNSAPHWTPFFQAQGFGDDVNGARMPCPSPDVCTLAPDSILSVFACDPDGDAITAEVEVVPRGTQFTGKATFSASAGTVAGNGCANLSVHMPGLAPEHSYDFAVRVLDQFGAVAAIPGFPEGWYHTAHEGFDQGPCTARQCACVPAGSTCFADLDCCSGSCDPQASGTPLLRRCK